ncbi:unnamed protein product [Polarella glacialis]|uniref:Uncharacterized protein n=1 Tax=Polarella glacialis TaxID=89957 RepID=A0A813KUV7_POLGL|nr:unnamed protein product [Polarella glacialis]CAE8712365.1 unnamed protein product [Polarella glacialis]
MASKSVAKKPAMKTPATSATVEGEPKEEEEEVSEVGEEDHPELPLSGEAPPTLGTARHRGRSPATVGIQAKQQELAAAVEKPEILPVSPNKRRLPKVLGALSVLTLLIALAAKSVAPDIADEVQLTLEVVGKLALEKIKQSSHEPCIYVQQSDVRGQVGFVLPEDTSPEKLVHFVNKHSWLSPRWCPEDPKGKIAYATTSSDTRWDETLFDGAQLERIGIERISAFLFVRIAPPELCSDDEEIDKVQEYVRERFDRDFEFSWLCAWDGSFVTGSSFVRRSLLKLDRALQSTTTQQQNIKQITSNSDLEHA